MTAPTTPAAQGTQDTGHITGERHASPVATTPRFNKRRTTLLIVGATGVLLAVVLLRPQAPARHAGRNDDQLRVRSEARYEAPPALPLPAPPLPALPPPLPPYPVANLATPPSAPDTLAHARRAPLLAYGSAAPTTARTPDQAAVPPDQANTGQQTELAARLQPTPLRAVAAAVLPHQPYLLTKGNILPCVLQTAIDSTLPGFVTCRLTQDVIGKTGITLLDRGTLVVGETRGGMQQGQARLFVLWTRAETPAGVVVELDSPAADPLGRTGFAGDVDSHFWARLGGTLLLSIVQGGLQQAASVGTGGTTINTSGIQGLSSDTVHRSIDIPPTLRKNQGELVSIFVARDLDFSSVYRLATVPGVVP